MTVSPTFRLRDSITLGEIVALTKCEPVGTVDLARGITGIAPLDSAGPADIAFYDSPRFLDDLKRTAAGACFVKPTQIAHVPAGVAVLTCSNPYLSMVAVTCELFGGALRPGPVFGGRGVDSGAHVHPEARLEDDVTVDPGAVIGPRAEIGSGTVIGANAVIGADVCIGRNCSIGPGATVLHALIGDRVILHPGTRIGQDGFGFIPGARGLTKVPQVGRVIIQDDVEVGAGTAIDRGVNRDTVVGEATKIDNLVQIGHNVTIGRHCIIVAQVGIAGSATLGERVQLGGQVGVADRLVIGDGARVAAKSGVVSDIPAGETWYWYPAMRARDAMLILRALDDLKLKKEAEFKGAGPAPIEGSSNEQTG
jgi:UDP-3-O-[3-hydroxymyristoyl] glucosamine N-acyltransferase